MESLNLCHGQMGNLDFLLESAMHFSNDYLNPYQDRASYLVEMIDRRFKTILLQRFLAVPGLMLGAAGLAYQLLRIAHPEDVPSVLLLKL